MGSMMKIVFSRKGFDDKYGGIPSVIWSRWSKTFAMPGINTMAFLKSWGCRCCREPAATQSTEIRDCSHKRLGLVCLKAGPSPGRDGLDLPGRP